MSLSLLSRQRWHTNSSIAKFCEWHLQHSNQNAATWICRAPLRIKLRRHRRQRKSWPTQETKSNLDAGWMSAHVRHPTTQPNNRKGFYGKYNTQSETCHTGACCIVIHQCLLSVCLYLLIRDTLNRMCKQANLGWE